MWGGSQANSRAPALGKASSVGGGSSAGGVNVAGNQPPSKLSDTPNPSVIPTPSTGYTLSKSDAIGNTSKDFFPNVSSSPLQWSEPSVMVLPSGDGDQQKTESARVVGHGGGGGGERASSAVDLACSTSSDGGERGDVYGRSTPSPAVEASSSTKREVGQAQTYHSDEVYVGGSGERVNVNAADSIRNPEKEILEEASSGRDVSAADVGNNISSDGSDKESFSYDNARVCDATKPVQATVALTVDSLEAGSWKPKPRDAGNDVIGRPEGGVRQGRSSITGAGEEGEMVNDGGVSSTIGRLRKQPVATRFGGRTRTP